MGVLNSAVYAGLAQILFSMASFTTSLIVVRTIGIEEFGKFSLCILLLMTSKKVTNATLLTPVTSISTNYLNCKSEKLFQQFSFTLAAIFSILLSATVFFYVKYCLYSQILAGWQSTPFALAGR